MTMNESEKQSKILYAIAMARLIDSGFFKCSGGHEAFQLLHGLTDCINEKVLAEVSPIRATFEVPQVGGERQAAMDALTHLFDSQFIKVLAEYPAEEGAANEIMVEFRPRQIIEFSGVANLRL